MKTLPDQIIWKRVDMTLPPKPVRGQRKVECPQEGCGIVMKKNGKSEKGKNKDLITPREDLAKAAVTTLRVIKKRLGEDGVKLHQLVDDMINLGFLPKYWEGDPDHRGKQWKKMRGVVHRKAVPLLWITFVKETGLYHLGPLHEEVSDQHPKWTSHNLGGKRPTLTTRRVARKKINQIPIKKWDLIDRNLTIEDFMKLELVIALRMHKSEGRAFNYRNIVWTMISSKHLPKLSHDKRFMDAMFDRVYNHVNRNDKSRGFYSQVKKGTSMFSLTEAGLLEAQRIISAGEVPDPTF